jgi:hypothetical protein
MRFSVRHKIATVFTYHAILRGDLLCDLVRATAKGKRTQNRTPNRIRNLVQKKDGKCFLSDTKSQIHQIASAICMQNRSCNQPPRIHMRFCDLLCDLVRATERAKRTQNRTPNRIRDLVQNFGGSCECKDQKKDRAKNITRLYLIATVREGISPLKFYYLAVKPSGIYIWTSVGIEIWSKLRNRFGIGIENSFGVWGYFVFS